MKYFIEKGTITLLNHIMTCDTQSQTYWVNVDSLLCPSMPGAAPFRLQQVPLRARARSLRLQPLGIAQRDPIPVRSQAEVCGQRAALHGDAPLHRPAHRQHSLQSEAPPPAQQLHRPFARPQRVVRDPFPSLPSALKLSSRQASLQQQIEESLQYATVLLESSNSPLLASAYYQQAVLAQRRREFQASVAFANSLVAITHPYDPLYLRALGVQFYAGQDPLGVISDINDILSFYCASTSFYLPWIIFSVGMLALPQDAELGMEYVNRALSLCKEVLGSSHPTLARMDLEVADVESAESS